MLNKRGSRAAEQLSNRATNFKATIAGQNGCSEELPIDKPRDNRGSVGRKNIVTVS